MAVPIPLSEVAVGDYSPEYGTVEQVVETGDTITLIFINKEHEVTQDKDFEIVMDQGGRFNHSSE